MYSGRIIFKVLAKLKQFNLAILPASNHRNIPYIGSVKDFSQNGLQGLA